MGMTRAMKKLFLLGARERTIYGESRFQGQSRFIDEIDPNYLEIIGPKGNDKNHNTPEDPQTFASEEPKVVYDYDIHTAGNMWQVGMKVKHPSFGIGVIKAKEGSGENTKLTILFHGLGSKKLALKYTAIIPINV